MSEDRPRLKYEYPAIVEVVEADGKPVPAEDIAETLSMLSGITRVYGVKLAISLRSMVPNHAERVDEGDKAEVLGTATIKIEADSSSLDAKLAEIEERLARIALAGREPFEANVREIVRDEISAVARRAARPLSAAGGPLRD